MARQQTDHLFKLIKSLTKAEKRNFKLYANRIGGDDNAKFLSLFNVIDKQQEYNEEEILHKVPEIKPIQLPNLKANLQKNLLVSLRLSTQGNDVDVSLRQQLDYAKILYNKALYRQSLIMLEKAKMQAKKTERELLYFEMIEFEKLIESQYITRSLENRADELSLESDVLNQRLTLAGALSNLALKLYGFYLKHGYVRSEEDQLAITDFFHGNMPAFSYDKLGFSEKMYLYQSHVWYYLIIQDFLMQYRYSLKWVELIKNTPETLSANNGLYVKGMNNMLEGLYFAGDFGRFEKGLLELEAFAEAHQAGFTKNVELLFWYHYFIHTINRHFMSGTFTEGTRHVPKIVAFIEQNEIYLDNHMVLIFYYKIACLYFGSDDYKNTIKYLNLVINYKDAELRSDLQCFARILNLMAHFEMQNYELIEYLVRTTYRFLSKMKDLHRAQKEILFFLRRLPSLPQDKLTDAFCNLLAELKQLRQDPYEKRPFLYLDIISWLESKISGVAVQEVIRQKQLTGSFEIKKRSNQT
ncbi:MAG: hypothetical protein AB7E36_16155 [Salinivirgaceae bacterium]